MRLGFVALTDAAPLVAADTLGLFSERGLRVELHREIGWATVRDKVVYGELDAAHAPAPMLWSAQLGLHCPPCDVVTGFVLNLHGNAITLSQALWRDGIRDDHALRARVRERRRRQPVTFAVVFPYSSHHLLLRDWLHAAGIDPDHDVRIVVVPPAQVFRNLAAGTIDGFCAGEPWNTLAISEGIGWCRLCSAHHSPGHVEKVLLVRRTFAEERADEHRALLAALSEASAWCDQPENRAALAELLAGPKYLNMPARHIAPALTGRFAFAPDRIENIPEFLVFHRDGANTPDVAQAERLQTALKASGLLPSDVDPHLPRHLFRADLHPETSFPPTHDPTLESSDLRGVAGR